MSEDIKSIVDIGLEGAAVVLLLTVSYKIYKMKCDFSSSCFKKDDNGILDLLWACCRELVLVKK